MLDLRWRCSHISFLFTGADHDECVDDTHICHVKATCINTEGSYSCECQPGYIGTGRNCEGGL